MINIRQGVFETNSSSMHSIAIRKQGGIPFEDFKKIDELNKMLIETLENRGMDVSDTGSKYVSDSDISFERYPFKALTSMFDKALYSIASVCGSEDIYILVDKTFSMSSMCKRRESFCRAHPDFDKNAELWREGSTFCETPNASIDQMFHYVREHRKEWK